MGRIIITAKTPIENLETEVSIDSKATVKELIQKVASIFNFDPQYSVIMFRGEELPPHRTLEASDIKDGFAVLVLPQALPKLVTVNVRRALGGQPTQVRIEPDATIRTVLELAVSGSALDMTRIIPMYNGTRLSLEETLENAGIRDGSTIVLTPRMEEPPEPQVPQPSTPPPQTPHTGVRTITPADERLLREMLGEYKMKSDSLERKMQNSFLVPKRVAYVLIVIVIILAVLILSWPYLSKFMM